jgi:hypothetical protein
MMESMELISLTLFETPWILLHPLLLLRVLQLQPLLLLLPVHLLLLQQVGLHLQLLLSCLMQIHAKARSRTSSSTAARL